MELDDNTKTVFNKEYYEKITRLKEEELKAEKERLIKEAREARLKKDKLALERLRARLAAFALAGFVGLTSSFAQKTYDYNKTVNTIMTESLAGANYEAIVDEYMEKYPNLFEDNNSRNRYRAFIAYELMEKGYDKNVVFYNLGFEDENDMLRKADFYQDIYENSASFQESVKNNPNLQTPVDIEEWIRTCKDAEKIVKDEIGKRFK